jgi:hypothetical protein
MFDTLDLKSISRVKCQTLTMGHWLDSRASIIQQDLLSADFRKNDYLIKW